MRQKTVEVQAYVLDDQMCDMCLVVLAPYFCANIHCLRYYCKHCWASVHSAHATQTHKCFIKAKGDRPRAFTFYPGPHQARGSGLSWSPSTLVLIRLVAQGCPDHLLPWSSSGSWLMAVLITFYPGPHQAHGSGLSWSPSTLVLIRLVAQGCPDHLLPWSSSGSWLRAVLITFYPGPHQARGSGLSWSPSTLVLIRLVAHGCPDHLA